MGHWADRVIPELKERLGISGEEQDAELLRYARQAQSEIELLTGHRFDGEPIKLNIDHGELPFVATLDMQTASFGANSDCWPIADPIHPEFSNVLQIARFPDVPPRASSKADALSAAAAVLAAVHGNGWLSFAPRAWFAHQAKAEPPLEFGHRLMDPGRHTHVPVVAGGVDGWWVQVSRRGFIVTKNTPDEPGLVEGLAPPGDGLAVVAGEPILTVARITEHPSDWAFVARVWVTEGAARPPRPWRAEARAVHAHGVPILSLDGQTTTEEVIAQMLLVAYWHGYLEGDETAFIPRSLAAAFPRNVASVKRGTGASDIEAAAALLFERLLRPGFDPTRGAESIRRYIARHATTLVRAHRASEAGFEPWRDFAIQERHYYKLLARLAEKGLDGRYEVDDSVKAKIRGYLGDRRQHEAAMAKLRGLGFGDDAARKWLQRHSARVQGCGSRQTAPVGQSKLAAGGCRGDVQSGSSHAVRSSRRRPWCRCCPGSSEP